MEMHVATLYLRENGREAEKKRQPKHRLWEMSR